MEIVFLWIKQLFFLTNVTIQSKSCLGVWKMEKKAFEWWDKLLYRPLFQQILHDDLQKMYSQYSCIVTTFWNWLPDNFLWMLRIKVQLGKVDNFREMYVRGKCRQTRQKNEHFFASCSLSSSYFYFSHTYRVVLKQSRNVAVSSKLRNYITYSKIRFQECAASFSETLADRK